MRQSRSRAVLTAVAVGVVGALAAACGDAETSSEGGRFDEVTSPPATARDAAADGEPSAPEAPGSSSGTATPSPPPTTTPGEPATCTTARDLGAISGDTGTASVTAQGTCSDWVRLRVTENDGGPFAATMKLTATLISPDKEDFDLFVHVNADSDVVECATVTGKSELPAGRSDIVKAEWGEQYVGNYSDDSRTVSVEVRKKTGRCATQPWALLLQGNY
jgi:hypothetical protein